MLDGTIVLICPKQTCTLKMKIFQLFVMLDTEIRKDYGPIAQLMS